MYKLLLFFLPAILILSGNNQFTNMEKPATPANKEISMISFQDEAGSGKMSSIEFKSQEYCRAELENFDFDAHFSIVSATVYFSGANFKNIEKGTIKSSSLKPISDLMKRCLPGTMVVFDDVKVKGPDDKLRTIKGLSLLLY